MKLECQLSKNKLIEIDSIDKNSSIQNLINQLIEVSPELKIVK